MSYHQEEDITGQRFGKLTALHKVEHPTYCCWSFRCDCGTIVERHKFKVTSGRSSHCGCSRKKWEGKPTTPEMEAVRRSWRGMIQRCTNPNHIRYKNYGGRGITICARWFNFENFYSDMGNKPTIDHTIERVDNDGNYELSNCRWATWTEQNNNRRPRCHS